MTAPGELPRRYLTVAELAAQIDLSEAVLRRMIRNHELPAVDLRSPGATRPCYRLPVHDIHAALLRPVDTTTPERSDR